MVIKKPSAEVKRKFITNARQFGNPRPAKRVEVLFPEFQAEGDEQVLAVWVHGMTQQDYSDLQETYVDNPAGGDVNLIAVTTRDDEGHRLWDDAAEAAKQLQDWPRALIIRLVKAANEAMTVDTASAEKN